MLLILISRLAFSSRRGGGKGATRSEKEKINGIDLRAREKEKTRKGKEEENSRLLQKRSKETHAYMCVVNIPGR